MIQKVLRHLLLLVLAVGLAHSGWAQGITTSSIAGTVTDQKGGELPGATVIAVHTPTGTQYVAPTNADGRYYIQNMRVGGPYTLKVTFVGYQDFNRSNVVLTVGQTQRIDVKLGDASTQLAEAVVVGNNPRSVLNAERTGPVTNISTEQLQRLPTIQRSLNDFLRLTPQASPTSQGAIGGGNYRQNNITVDGSDFNNNFGIGGNLPANGSPISLDALEELTVNIAPFDVRQSGFVGSAVNAVTRSGSNQVQGSLYTFYRNQNYIGKNVAADQFTINPTTVRTYGARVGGPIVKDKLFFFLSYERSTEDIPGPQNIASTTANPYGSASNVARPTAALLDSYSSYLQSTYGYATGPYQSYNFQNTNSRYLGRIDWNINNKNHLSIRYNQVNSHNPIQVSTSRSPLANYPQTRTSIFALPFANSNYFQDYNFYSGALELNSTLGTRLFNTLRLTYTNQNDPRSSNSSIFPFVDILDGSVPRTTSGTAIGGFASYSTPYTSFGYEPFTFGNLRQVETYSAVDFLSGTFGKHTLTGGVQFDLQSTKNGFQRFATSYYTYNSWSDFQNGANPVDFAITYSLLPGFQQAFPRFKTAQYSAYVQDEYAISEKFRLTYGLRAELNSYLNVQEIKTNPLIAAQSLTDGRRIDTGILPQNRVLLSPRIGFNWDVKGDRTLQLRGGSGIFTGKVPTVWIVAQSGDAGMIQVTQQYSTVGSGTNAVSPGSVFGSIPGFNQQTGVLPFSPDPAAHRPDVVPTAGTLVPSTASATDPNFRNPQAWKSALALDAKLPGGIVGTLEGTYNKDLIVAYGQNYNLVNPRSLAGASAGQPGFSDNRDFYPNAVGSKFTSPLYGNDFTPKNNPNGTPVAAGAFNPIVLSNGYKGYYWSATAQLQKSFSSGLQASLAYTRSDARVLFDGSGDQLLNTWSGTYTVNNANNPALSYANYVAPDRIVASLTYRKEYLRHLGTTISFFYSGSIQGRYSYIYSADFNRDGQTNDLIYIPKDANDITFSDFNYGTTANPNVITAAQQNVLFQKFIDQDPYLSQHRGEYAERNGATLPWRHQVDFRAAQDIFVSGKTRNALQFTFDVFNFGNLLNRNWGIFQQPVVSNGAILAPTNVSSLVEGGTVKPTFRLSTYGGAPIQQSFVNTITTASTYYMQIGLRYSFN
ncbi:TonB-dependent receptor [Hymenobacter sp. RP-2-7]|uniref:TonB-dependent receptor n=1 Tax=Hymenobacter polaris TaxID=2682546 RepID=A0A7Y0FNL7_9BACT|nr:TonB-dependent receptor [Hymenobacter polaris]NML66630.1 TonB-dependent receptor [Hymenobacter polaris]